MSVKPECEQYYQLDIKADAAVFMRVTRRGKAHKLVHAVLAVVMLVCFDGHRKDPGWLSI